ncbi:MAG: WbqC family protein [Opitutae bacterium]|nr:WbqC family protein [Opitutae bacterium]MBT7742738.1 WbqC family protein [Opitutae bacterium]
MKLSIHQPDFFPWLGLFHKIAHSERFVVFDHVQTPQGKSWLTRNRILLNGEPRWMTLPIHRKGLQPIYAVEVNYEVNFKPKHLGTLRQAYQKASFFEEIFSFVENLYADSPRTVQEFTLRAIEEICSSLGIGTEFVLSSEIVSKNPELSNLGANDLVLELCLHSQASFYISGTGCLDFIRPETFSAKGIEFNFQAFSSPPYAQVHGEPFVSHMSILDALFNLGFSGTAELLTEPMLKSASKYFSEIGGKNFG